MTRKIFNAPFLRAALLSTALLGFCAPAFAIDPTPAQLELGRQLADASGATKSFDGVINNLVAQTQRTLTQTRPELKAQVEETLTLIRPEYDVRKKEMVDIAAKIFASDLTEAQLKDSVAFFTSESGKKYVSSQPDMLNKLVTSMQAWQRVLSTDMIERLRFEFKKKNIEF